MSNAPRGRVTGTEHARFQALVQHAHDCVLVTDELGALQYVSPAFERIFGYQANGHAGWTWHDLLVRDNHEAFDDAWQAIIDSPRTPVTVTLCARHASEGSVWLDVVGTSWLDDERVRGVVFNVRNGSRRMEDDEHLQRLSAIVTSSEDAIFSLLFDGTITSWNPGATRMFGYDAGNAVGRSVTFLYPPDRADDMDIIRGMILSGQSLHRYRTKRLCSNGEIIDVSLTISPLRDATGEITGTAVTARDITEHLAMVDALQTSENSYRMLMDQAADGIVVSGPDGVIQTANRRMRDIIGFEPDELIGKHVMHFIHPNDLAEQPMDVDGLRNGAVITRERVLLHKNGTPIVTESSATLLPDGRVQIIIRDITERKQLEAQLSHLALHDALTGLPNRTLLTDRLDQVVSATRHTSGTVAVLFLDIDNFKIVNDSLGHDTGDQLLVEVGAMLRQMIRSDHTVARFGGDEFVIVGKVDGVAEAIQTAEMILDRLREPFSLENREIVVNLSIGIALGHNGELNGQDLLRHADLAMYRAKSIGKNRYELFDSGLQATAIERLELEHDLRHAIELAEMSLAYQPIIDLATGTIVSLEALLRWRHARREMIPPDQFIPIAEESGLIVEIGKWVLQEACRQIAVWSSDPAWPDDLRVSVNLSARQFQQPDLSRVIADALAMHGVCGTRLQIEITESDVMADPDQAIARLHELKLLGISTAIDDFGTGYSSLSLLHAFPIDILKIDRSFIDSMGQQPNGTPIVSATINLAHNLGLQTVAEGIESDHQLSILRHLGCDRGQGFYFAGPLRPEQICQVVPGNAVTGWCPAPQTGELRALGGNVELLIVNKAAADFPVMSHQPSHQSQHG